MEHAVLRNFGGEIECDPVSVFKRKTETIQDQTNRKPLLTNAEDVIHCKYI